MSDTSIPVYKQAEYPKRPSQSFQNPFFDYEFVHIQNNAKVDEYSDEEEVIVESIEDDELEEPAQK